MSTRPKMPAACNMKVFAGLLVCAGFVGGCAVPQAALDQANNASNLMLTLEGQVSKHRNAQASVAQARIKSVREQRQLLVEYASATELDVAIIEAAGDTEQANLFAKLQALSDQKAKSVVDLQAALVELDEKMSKVLSPVPSTAKTSADAQKAMGVLGLQRSGSESFAFLTSFAGKLKDGAAPAAAEAASGAAGKEHPNQGPPPAAAASAAAPASAPKT
jgi:hypothetical protein